MTLSEALWRDPERMGGATCFRGTRIPVSVLFDHLVTNDLKGFYEGFPEVSSEMVEAVLEGSRRLIEDPAVLR
jgi:uncharacterized protein (DUF433 family)